MAKKFQFQIMDNNDHVEIGRTVTFPYEIDAERLDKEIALIFIKLAEEKESND